MQATSERREGTTSWVEFPPVWPDGSSGRGDGSRAVRHAERPEVTLARAPRGRVGRPRVVRIRV
jgi:hypothetical protein